MLSSHTPLRILIIGLAFSCQALRSIGQQPTLIPITQYERMPLQKKATTANYYLSAFEQYDNECWVCRSWKQIAEPH